MNRTEAPNTPGWRSTLESVADALDDALGDTDITHVESDDELREIAPVQWACSQVNRLLQTPQSESAAIVQVLPLSQQPPTTTTATEGQVRYIDMANTHGDKASEQQRALEVIAELADDFGLPLGTTIEQVATHARYLQQERARLLFAQSAGTASTPTVGERAVSFHEWWDALPDESFLAPSPEIKGHAWKAWNAALDAHAGMLQSARTQTTMAEDIAKQIENGAPGDSQSNR